MGARRRTPPRRGRAAAGALALLPSLLAACAGAPAPPPAPPARELPREMLPQAAVIDPDEFAAGDLISYRRLTRDDFRGSAPPPQVAAHADAAGAFTCASITSVGSAKASFEPTAKPGVYVARFAEAEFRARMDRSCSWWNARREDVPAEYVLEHEQVHFALTELAARRLTAKLAAVRLETTPAEGPSLLQQRFEALLEEARQEMLRTNTDFDRETSGRYAPEAQREWLRRVERDLAAATPPEPA